MTKRKAWLLLAGGLTVAANVPADIVWSGEQNLSIDYLSGRSLPIDLNSDSLVDVSLYYSFSGDASGEDGRLDAYVDRFGVDGPSRILVDSSDRYNAALPFDTMVSGTPDPSLEWGTGSYFSGTVSYWAIYPPIYNDEEWNGLLGENGNTYIGIEFEVEGAIHYGWVNIALGPVGYLGFKDPITTSWAYESTPNTAIVAGAIPEPSTGILTLAGSISLLFLARSRRRGNHVRVTRGKW